MSRSVEVEGAGCACAGFFHDVEVDHGGGNIRMSEEVLDGADIDTGFQEVRGEGMSERVAGGPFRQSDPPNRLGDLAGEGFFVKMKSPESPGSGVWGKVGGGKGPLPRPFAACVRILSADLEVVHAVDFLGQEVHGIEGLILRRRGYLPLQRQIVQVLRCVIGIEIPESWQA